MLSGREQSLLKALEPRAIEEGIEIVTVEVVGSKKSPTVRVYIDTPHGCSFDDIEAAQEWIDKLMDELDPFPGAYMLEVSSPGIDRPLRTPAHFARFTGETAVIKTSSPVDGRSNFTGIIVNTDEEAVELQLEGAPNARVPYSLMKRAHLRGIVDFKK